MKYYCQICKNQYDNIMVQKDVSASWLKNAIENPLIVENKDEITQWKFCTVNDKKRCTENINQTNILMLDFDDSTYSINDFETRFREYKYILHTSYSYDGIKQKFRVLLFLDRDYEVNRLFFKGANRSYSPYHFLIDYFPHIDPASFVKAQFFKMPAIKSKDSPYYFKFNNGKLFSMKDIPFYIMAYDECIKKYNEYLKQLEKEYEKQRKKNGGDLTKAKEFVDKKLEATPEGHRHNAIFGLAAWFSRIGGTYSEFCEIMPSWADSKFHRQIDRLAHEWVRIGSRR